MNSSIRRTAMVLGIAALVLALTAGSASQALAQWGFYYNPGQKTAGWQVGPYTTQYQWGNNWFHSQGFGPGGFGGNYYQSPNYTGWSHWGPNHSIGQGKFAAPWLNNGQPIFWQY